MLRRSSVVAAALAILSLLRCGESLYAEQRATSPPHSPANQPTKGEWGDQGDGTYANPVMPADFSDLDAIRVGTDYYAISSTFQYSPGVAVLHSKDLVNWSIIGHVVDDIVRIDPELNWNKMGRAGRGIWAGSIRYHAGKFWVYFGTPDQGIFMSTAPDAQGPWTPVKNVLSAAGWDDPCPFWDDDGQGYLVATHFAPELPGNTTYNIHLFKMNIAGDELVRTSDRTIHRSNGSEANKLYKISGLYYHLYSEVRSEGRVVMMERSKSLGGPWEIRQLNHVHPKVDKEPNQGGLIRLRSGEWYFLSHQGTGDWEGRAGVLLPVTWIDGWPILGTPGPDGIGNMVWRGIKPIQSTSRKSLGVSDNFDQPKLRPAWEWNYQPRADRWSLSERPGFLRLYAFPPLDGGGFMKTGNVITQRAMRTKLNQVTVKLDLSGSQDGEETGIAHYAATYCTLSLLRTNGTRHLCFNDNGQRSPGPVVRETTMWMRSTWGFNGLSQFSYSIDGDTFLPIGDACQLTWGNYRGDRIGIFTSGPHGHVDIDSFRYEVSP